MSASEYKYVRRTYTYNGKRYEVRGKTKREAERRLAELIAKLKNGDVGISMNMSVDRWCDEWLETYVKPRVREPGEPKQSGTMSQNSYKTYETYVRLYLKPALVGVRLRDVTEADLRQILNSQAGKSFGHVSRIRMVIRACFSQATASRIIPYDPSLNLTLPANIKGSRRSLTDAERKALYTVAEDNSHGVWIRTLLETGMRPGESAALKVADIDFKEKLIRIDKAVEAGTAIISTPKSNAGIRFVPLPESLSPYLEESVLGKAAGDLVFPQAKYEGKVMTKTCRRRYWGSFKRLMDIELGAEVNNKGKVIRSVIAPDLSLYCLRHTYCTDLQRAGVPLNVARYLMGHSDIAITAQIYTHSDKAEALSAAKLINLYNEKKSGA